MGLVLSLRHTIVELCLICNVYHACKFGSLSFLVSTDRAFYSWQLCIGLNSSIFVIVKRNYTKPNFLYKVKLSMSMV